MSTGVANDLIKNAIGRHVPTHVNGRETVPYQGVNGYRPVGNKAGPPIRSNRDYASSGDKRVPDLETALRLCGLRDGMTISSHHHLRNGDRVALSALQTAASIGGRDLIWFPGASAPCTRARNQSDEVRRRPPHRGQHERPAWRLLFARPHARPWRVAFARWALAGPAGWRGPRSKYRCNRLRRRRTTSATLTDPTASRPAARWASCTGGLRLCRSRHRRHR